MAYEWSWFGLANVVASVLLVGMGLLFLRAKRSEFTLTFAVYSLLAAGQKFAGGVALYLASDEATRDPWLLVSGLFLVASTPTLAHALAAFTWSGRFRRRSRLMKGAIYLPFALLLPVLAFDAQAFQSLSLAYIVAFLTILVVFIVPVSRVAWRGTSATRRKHGRYVLAYIVIAVSFSIEARVILYLYETMPWWELSMAYMAATGVLLYGILHSHIFDIDLRLKFALRQSTVAAIFIAAFFIVSELAAALLSDQVGTVLGIVAAGLLLFALAPLHRFAQHLSDRAMPHVSDSPEYLSQRKIEVYRAALELAAEDGVITSRERDVLARLQDELGLSAIEARDLEHEVVANQAA